MSNNVDEKDDLKEGVSQDENGTTTEETVEETNNEATEEVYDDGFEKTEDADDNFENDAPLTAEGTSEEGVSEEVLQD